MDYTLENDSITRWKALRLEALKPIGREVSGYALVAIDSTGEVYWGGQFPKTTKECARLIHWLKVIEKDCHQYMNSYAKETVNG